MSDDANKFDQGPLPSDASHEEVVEYGRTNRRNRAELSRTFAALKKKVLQAIAEAEALGNTDVADQLREQIAELAVRQARLEEGGELNDELSELAGFKLDDNPPKLESAGMAAELDYAFVADYARVEAGKLTALGASYTKLRTAAFPVNHTFSIAGRVRAPEDTEAIALVLRVVTPGPAMNIEFHWTVNPGPESDRYDGKVGVLFALGTSVAILEAGLVEIFIEVDGVPARRLAFDVELIQAP